MAADVLTLDDLERDVDRDGRAFFRAQIDVLVERWSEDGDDR